MDTTRSQPEDEGWAGCASWLACIVLAIPYGLVGGLVGYLLKVDILGSVVTGIAFGVAIGSGFIITLAMCCFSSIEHLRDCFLISMIVGGMNCVLFVIGSIGLIVQWFNFMPEDSIISWLLPIPIVILCTFIFVILEGLINPVLKRNWKASLPLIITGGVLIGLITGAGIGIILNGMALNLGTSGALVGLLSGIILSIFIIKEQSYMPASQS